MMALTCNLKISVMEWMSILIRSTARLNLRVDLQVRHLLQTVPRVFPQTRSMSDISIGRYKLTTSGAIDGTDLASTLLIRSD